MPKEEVLPKAPVAPAYQEEGHEKAVAARGDIIDEISIECTYQAARTEEIKYPSEGAPIDELCFKVGDKVKAGDIVAKLSMGDIPNQIQELKNLIADLRLQLEQENESKELDSSNEKALENAMAAAGQAVQELDVTSKYNLKIRELRDTIYIKEKSLQKLEAQKESLLIRAGMDGIVSYLINLDIVKNASGGTIIMKIEDNNFFFVAKVEDKSWFTEGKEVAVHIDETDYPVKVVTAQSLGIEETEADNTKDVNVYFQLLSPDYTLSAGSRGSIDFIRDERSDVLLIPSKGLIQNDSGYCVYLEGEGGLKTLQKVEVGLISEGKAEITGGLKEGDTILIE